MNEELASIINRAMQMPADFNLTVIAHPDGTEPEARTKTDVSVHVKSSTLQTALATLTDINSSNSDIVATRITYDIYLLLGFDTENGIQLTPEEDQLFTATYTSTSTPRELKIEGSKQLPDGSIAETVITASGASYQQIYLALEATTHIDRVVELADTVIENSLEEAASEQ